MLLELKRVAGCMPTNAYDLLHVKVVALLSQLQAMYQGAVQVSMIGKMIIFLDCKVISIENDIGMYQGD